MLKKTITFDDLDGNPVTEDFYFNLTAADLAEMEMSREGGLKEHLKKLIETNNGEVIISTFKDIIIKSVGRRSEDGRRFLKSQDITDEFLQTDAYSVMFMELVTDANAAVLFVNAVVPRSLRGALDAPVVDVNLPKPPWVEENREPTDTELSQMSQNELVEAFRVKLANGQKAIDLQKPDELPPEIAN